MSKQVKHKKHEKRQRHRNERKARDKRHPESSLPAKGLLEVQEKPITAGKMGRTRRNEGKLLEGQEKPTAKAPNNEIQNDQVKCP